MKQKHEFVTNKIKQGAEVANASDLEHYQKEAQTMFERLNRAQDNCVELKGSTIAPLVGHEDIDHIATKDDLSNTGSRDQMDKFVMRSLQTLEKTEEEQSTRILADALQATEEDLKHKKQVQDEKKAATVTELDLAIVRINVGTKMTQVEALLKDRVQALSAQQVFRQCSGIVCEFLEVGVLSA